MEDLTCPCSYPTTSFPPRFAKCSPHTAEFWRENTALQWGPSPWFTLWTVT